MEFLTFEDETAIVETTFFPQAYRRFCHIIDRQRPYLLTGKVEEDWGATTLTVDRVERIMRSDQKLVKNSIGLKYPT
jgi:DNA polymerase III alpha subunit